MSLKHTIAHWLKRPTNADERANKTILRRTTLVMILLGILIFIPLIGNLYYVMIMKHDYYEQRAINNQTVSTSLTASRGSIYDRNMNILATSSSVENVFLDPGLLVERNEDLDLIARGLAPLIGVDEAKIREEAAKTNLHYVVLARKLEQEQSDAVRKFLDENHITSVNLEPDSKRYYPYTTLAAQIIGFTNADSVGAEGLEAYYDSVLEGTAGRTISTEGAQGTEMLYNYVKYYEPSDGDNIVLTLDNTVQYYLEKEMQAAIDNYSVLNGAFGIVMDVNTGEILAMANFNQYDPNNYLEIYEESDALEIEALYDEAMGYAENSQEREDAIAAYNAAVATARLSQWRNRCVSDGYEPGSTFKLITLASALDSGAVSLNDTFYCGGAENIADRAQTLHCWKAAGHGQETTAQTLQNSCNIAFAHIGLQMGGETLYNYVKDFGLLEYTGIDLPGEGLGYFYQEEQLADRAKYGSSYLTTTSFGQSFKITPIQLVRAVAAIVNGGYLLEPYIVSEIQDADGNVVTKNSTTVLRQVISEETSATMCELMEEVVTLGTASGAKVAGYRIGGKTGTSEKLDVYDENGVATEDKFVSFVGVAPIDDPKYVCLIVLDTPSRETGLYISGGIMAAPTVGAVLGDILPYLGVEPDYDDDEIDRIAVSMPDVIGMTESRADAALAAYNLTYQTVGEGDTVTAQIPSGGAQLPGGSKVILYMGEEKPTDRVVVPNVTGMTAYEANIAMTNSGLYLLSRGTNSTNGTVHAIGQDIEAGTEVERGTMITVTFADSTALD